MSRSRSTLLGRHAEQQTLDELVYATDGSGALVTVRGDTGIGKSALLHAVSAGWRRDELRVLQLNAAEQAAALPQALLGVLREQWDQHSDPSLLSLLHAASRTRTTHSSVALVHELVRVLGRLARSGRTVLLLEDLDRGVDVAGTLGMLCRGAVAGGVVVIGTTRQHADVPGASAAQGTQAGETVLDLPGLGEDDVHTLLSREHKLPLDPALITALRAALGDWFGNPGTALDTLATLVDQGRVVVLDGHLCLRGGAAVTLPRAHVLLDTACAGSPADRVAGAVAELGAVRVDDLPSLAAAMGVEPDACGLAHDALVRSGVLAVDGAGRSRPSVPALGVALRERLTGTARAGLHAGFVQAQYSVASRGAGVDLQAMAEHVLRAGERLPCGAWADLLVAEARRLEQVGGAYSDRCLRAAVRGYPPQDPRWPEVAAAVLHELVLGNRFDELAQDVAEVIAPGLPSSAAEPWLYAQTVVLWLVALSHENTGREHRGQDALLRTLIEHSGCAAELREITDAVRGGRLRMAVDVLRRVVAATGGSDELAARRTFLLEQACDVLDLLGGVAGDEQTFHAAARAWQQDGRDRWGRAELDRVRTAGLQLDYATVLKLALGERYTSQPDGPLGVYRDVLRGYHDGDWDAALSRARSLRDGRQRIDGTHALVHAFAAEICVVRGETGRAAGWLDGVVDRIPGGALVTWARCGQLWQNGDGAAAVREGWAGYRWQREQGTLVGAERLLLRVAHYANRLGSAAQAQAAVDELRTLHDAVRSTQSLIAFSLADGVCRTDREALQAGWEHAGGHGSTYLVLRSCMELARLADDPHPLLREAHHLVRRLGATVVRAELNELMRTLGVPQPRIRSRRQEFSVVEARIVQLVRDGCTNRQIAAAMAISEKSVEGHLTRLFSRTGYRSRVQLAAALLDGKLTEAQAGVQQSTRKAS